MKQIPRRRELSEGDTTIHSTLPVAFRQSSPSRNCTRLERLQGVGYGLHILSNGDRDMLEAAAGHIGFAFDSRISVQEAGYFKPAWQTYAKAEELIELERSALLFVANHAFDCIGAKSYGMHTAFIDRRARPFGETPHQPDLVVVDFKELAEVMV